MVLLGLMGSGKTSVGRRVAERLGRRLVDGDAVLEAATGRTAREVADAQGIDELHRREVAIALGALGATAPSVIGPGAFVIEDAEVRSALEGHVVVWLTASAEHLASRAAGKGHRPLVHDGDVLALMQEQLRVREPLALALADLVIDITTSTRDEQAESIVRLVRSEPGAQGT